MVEREREGERGREGEGVCACAIEGGTPGGRGREIGRASRRGRVITTVYISPGPGRLNA